MDANITAELWKLFIFAIINLYSQDTRYNQDVLRDNVKMVIARCFDDVIKTR